MVQQIVSKEINMYKWILLFLLIPSVAFGAVNEKYSYKDLMDIDLSKINASEFNNSTIVGSNFYQQESPDKDIFPNGLTGVIFEKCNLDNVKIKDGMVLGLGNSNRQIKIQNDLEDWKVEKVLGSWKAKEPLNKANFIELGISIDAKDIPAIKQDKSATEIKYEEVSIISIDK